jgi:alpha-D-ribose 1-methylphosphonate 5-triphosphate synthase subunit PhnG
MTQSQFPTRFASLLLKRDMANIDDQPAEFEQISVDLSESRLDPGSYFELKLRKPAVGFVMVKGPITGTLKLHPRQRTAPPLDLTIIDKFPAVAQTFYLENSAVTDQVSILFLHNLDLLFVLSPSRQVGVTTIQGNVGVIGTVSVAGAVTVLNSSTDALVAISTQRTTGYSAQYTVGVAVVTGVAQVIPNGFSIYIWADASNTVEVAFTLDGVTAPVVGINASLKPGQGFPFQLDNINRLKFIASAAGQKMNIAAVI